jgi:hypothetical protein
MIRDIMLETGDIVFTRGDSLLAKAIRWAETEPGEEPTETNHVGVITKTGSLHSAEITEALWKVQTAPMYVRYHKQGKVAVFRPLNVEDEGIEEIQAEALAHVGQTYGWWKLVFHLAARLTRWQWVKSLLFVDSRPICSYLVALAYQKAGLTFGIEGRSADPDEMMDYCLSHPGNYLPVIYPMEQI